MMALLDRDDSVLVVVDAQPGFLHPEAVERMAWLVALAARLGIGFVDARGRPAPPDLVSVRVTPWPVTSAFRIVGHFLSVRGARQGLVAVTWGAHASTPLSALRGMVGIPPDVRAPVGDRCLIHLDCLHCLVRLSRKAN